MIPSMREDSPARQHRDFVAKFLQNGRGAIPLTIEQIDMMLRLLAAAHGGNIRNFLNLGCGGGFLASAILDEYPRARGLLVDLSAPTVEAARRRMPAHTDRIECLDLDYQQPAWICEATPHAPFDAVVSGFASHHLPEARKRALFQEIFDLLAPEGIFINVEHVSSATRWTESYLDDYAIEAIFGAQLKAFPGKTRAEVARAYYAHAAQDPEVPAPLEVQCDWLREIGYSNGECYLKMLDLAVFGGQKPGP